MKGPGTAYDDPVLGKDPQPAHMSNYVRTFADNGGVHINSGIPNHAFYLTAMQMGGYAWEKAGRIWYETLRDPQLRPNTSFKPYAQLTLRHAEQLYGSGSPERQAVRDGWSKVGIELA
jgi:Zn-dependent metalloprotease